MLDGYSGTGKGVAFLGAKVPRASDPTLTFMAAPMNQLD